MADQDRFPITMILCGRGPRGRRCQVVSARVCPDCHEPIVTSVTVREPAHQCALPFGEGQ
jgi:hypothetical protein